MSMPGVGVVVGRFQVHSLHEAHGLLINRANQHRNLMVFLASPTIHTLESPLDFATRAAMIRKQYPNATIVLIKDHPSDDAWSQHLDRAIEMYYQHMPVTLYSGRDGFQTAYTGKNRVVEIEDVKFISGTEIRSEVGEEVIDTEEFRRGIIYAYKNQFSRVSPAVDIALVKDRKYVALIKREYEGAKWRFPGGFVDANQDDSYEKAARRELMEETGLHTENKLKYVGDFLVSDWRNTPTHRIYTTLFFAEYSWGSLKAGDDAFAAEWLNMDKIKNMRNSLDEDHIPLYEALLKYMEAIDE